MLTPPGSKALEEKIAEVPKIYKIVDQDILVGPSRRHSVLATPDRIFKQDAAVNKALHAGNKTDLILQFIHIQSAKDCTPAWVERNEEIFAASFARKCLRNLLANNERKLRAILAVECSKQRDLRYLRKASLAGISRQRRLEEKATYRFLRTAVNSPSLSNRKKPFDGQNANEADDQKRNARMLITEFEILMRQFGVRIVNREQLERLFKAVKADEKNRNYITLEQFLAWYRRHRVGIRPKGKLTKWRSVKSGSYDVSMARLSVIRYCVQAAMVHGREMFTKQLDDYLELESKSSKLLLPPSPDMSPGTTNPARRIRFSNEHKVETPTSYFSTDDKDLASDGAPFQTEGKAMQPPTPPEPASQADQPEKFLKMSKSARGLIDLVTPLEPETPPKAEAPESFLDMSESAKALIDFVTGGITEVVAEESDMSGAETDDDFDPTDYESGGDSSFERTTSFDAAAYIEMACDEMTTTRSPDEDSSDYMDALLDEDPDNPNNMSESAKALIESLLVFSEDGMDEIANHIESNRNEDQLAEEEIENFIDDVADQAIGSYVNKLELHPDKDDSYKPYV